MREMKDSGVEWLGEVPAGWGVVPVKRVAVLKHGSDPKTAGDTPVYGSGQSAFKTCGEFKEGPSVLLGRKGTLNCPQYVEGRFWNVDTAFDVSMRSGDMALKYFFYAISSVDIGDLSTNTAKPSMTQGAWCSVKLPNPPIDEQCRISDFLDEKCAEIDRAVFAAERSVEEYKAYQNDVVKRAIVYGTCNAFKVKESGVPAIGKMNASWGLVMVKRLAVFLNGDRSDSYPSGDDIQEAGIPFITSGDLNGRYLPDVFSKYISQDKYDSLKGVKLRRGDVVFCLRGSVGKCSLNRTENCGTVASSLTVARPICCAPEWLSYALTCSSTTNQAMATAIGATSANLAANVLARAFVPLPPLSEQRLIADYLDEKCTQIDAAIAAKQAIIADLKAYKQSLIYETVTGKREV